VSGVRVFCVSHFLPSAVGHGGMHRAFQIAHDVRDVVGEAGFAAVNLAMWRQARASRDAPGRRHAKLRQLGSTFSRIGPKLARVLDNPFKLITRDRYPSAIPFSTRGWVEQEFIADYQRLVSKERGPAVCIVEHAVFGEIVELNNQLGIPTISAFHNLESLDATRFDWRSRKTVYKVMTDLGNELRLLGQCSDRLFISKVEAGFVGGLGLECHYYPYLPTGAIREGLLATRRRRSAGEVEPGLILLLGSASRGVTGESMRWFVERLTDEGLPSGVRVVAVGYDTQTLLPPARTPAWLEPRGWVRQEELDTLLARAALAIIPQRLGFGALTRLPELTCAGVPVITFSHASRAIDPPPGVQAMDPDWSSVRAAMRDRLKGRTTVDTTAYERWEAEQPRPVREVLGRLLGY
jgi:hypothetical protein